MERTTKFSRVQFLRVKQKNIETMEFEKKTFSNISHFHRVWLETQVFPLLSKFHHQHCEWPAWHVKATRNNLKPLKILSINLFDVLRLLMLPSLVNFDVTRYDIIFTPYQPSKDWFFAALAVVDYPQKSHLRKSYLVGLSEVGHPESISHQEVPTLQ